ncbi:hypothetical protein RSAG8_05965, partial [Rhizoctonia solani AG-8 WAC10335]
MRYASPNTHYVVAPLASSPKLKLHPYHLNKRRFQTRPSNSDKGVDGSIPKY